jgi:hypothetical protein
VHLHQLPFSLVDILIRGSVNLLSRDLQRYFNMRFNWTASLLVVLATSEAVGASTWFGKTGI